MYRVLIISISTILIITTMCISFLKPKMHKNIMIYDSNYQLVEIEKDTKPLENIPEKTNYKKTEVKQKTEVKSVKKQETKQPPKKEIKNVVKVEKPQPIVKTQKIEQKTEIIKWNKWRSDIQNSVMKDAILPYVEEGTVFRFSFEVDKYGKISNLHTWSSNPMYTPYAIQYIAPVIKSYQGRELLKFPTGSNRYSTVVEGGWMISNTSRYSSPSDYKDIEELRK